MEKRGQFYLMAALIIVGILAGTFYVRNYVYVASVDKQVVDIKEILELESLNVLDYGFYDDEDIEGLLERFGSNYLDYIGGDVNFFFIYGEQINNTHMVFRAFICTSGSSGAVSIGDTSFSFGSLTCGLSSSLIQNIDKVMQITGTMGGEPINFPINPTPGEAKNFWISVKSVD